MIATLELAHVVSTLGMVAVIWFVQIVHYPLFARVGPASFVAYERDHVGRISRVVMPLMLTELATAAALVLVHPPHTAAWEAWCGLALVGLLWGSTFFVQVPLHRALAEGFDGRAVSRLVRSNWIRTALWTARGVLVGVALWRALAG